jgi:hypothetical protein
LNIKNISDNPRTFKMALKMFIYELLYSLDEWHNVGSFEHPTSPQGYTNIAFHPFSGPIVPTNLSLLPFQPLSLCHFLSLAPMFHLWLQSLHVFIHYFNFLSILPSYNIYISSM